jgi:SAM-dependent methyltransferase
MDLGFRGEVAELYQRYRRGYPDEVVDLLTGAFGLSTADLVVDLGCGTGQLALPLAGRVRAVLGVDPEPDMLVAARRAASARRVSNVGWLAGADTDLPVLRALLGEHAIAAVTVGQALHWMDHAALFRALPPLLRPGGGVAVVTNGTPLWSQECDWSRALRDHLEEWRGRPLRNACGTDAAAQRAYREALAGAGFATRTAAVTYTATLSPAEVVGGVLSALPVDELPADRERFGAGIGAALAPHAPFTEHVRVTVLTGTLG